MLRRPLALALLVVSVALAAPTAALAVRVHVRVEGVTRTIFGGTEPLLAPVTGSVTAGDGSMIELSRPTALGALEAASRAGEFFYQLVLTSIGPFVSQIGRFSGGGSSGWAYKVNGVSPPVGADAYVVKPRDHVLWYYSTFSDAGGSKTLDLAATRGCYQAVEVDDSGNRTVAKSVVFNIDGRDVNDGDGLLCPKGRWHDLRVAKTGDIRSKIIARR